MNHCIGQDQTCIVRVGDRVTNLATTICGLVLAFTDTSDDVACYHLPYMDCSAHHLRKLMEVMARIGPISNIVVVSNDFETERDKEFNTSAVSTLQRRFGVRTTYYVSPETVGDITVLVKKGGVRFVDNYRQVDF